MLSNLPPGVSEWMIPGNTPDDEEVEVCFVLTIGDINDLYYLKGKQDKLPQHKRHELYPLLCGIIEQLDEQEKEKM